MKIATITLTNNGKCVAEKIRKYIKTDIFTKKDNILPLKDFVKRIFHKYDALILIMATGIVVRTICGFIKDKYTDPAIVVIDEKGKNVISLLSGHVGGANELTLKIAKILNANPVITTATDLNNVPAIDLIAKKYNFEIENKENIKVISSMLVNNEKVDFIVDDYLNIDIKSTVYKNSKAQVYITNKIVNSEKTHVILRPKNIVVGIGCKKDIPFKQLLSELEFCFKKLNLSLKSICTITSAEIKKDEKAIIELSKYLKVPIKFYTLQEIKKIEHLFECSSFVKKTFGICGVSRHSAYLESKGKEMLFHKKNGITISVWRK
ncbi:cobalamin biosynthesis protein CbiG [Thermosipho melanesiensis]|uniref:Cobalamin (Vitamin B12) biosynthesis CbiG protein n=2 Tax=Thermosipho melanesiensis TaxID=46541 RepID=A6LKW6_THEM4|nr:cobalt-precorrin 5A hydrolase [Thermosipho melanesiensis]ABR30567.1 cobalamin (vitamin B12) biosynthesis CbiG protein [Thermosipho melanesiensis BI429]APT73715.1 cobalamin biosynthesis protein CbiG [Thermosipho melanesiensis]OOC35653.1 cobalamin biosynthesis protein CbiG [Thermosipho melanesiensis]OOC38952.1 cobalamin biosynthesis protein CbiG [Thermosipho melanesiensis]OOC39100.1 cobalamin biosynthesis protein CbiG [Thermosipho melanesiensis]